MSNYKTHRNSLKNLQNTRNNHHDKIVANKALFKDLQTNLSIVLKQRQNFINERAASAERDAAAQFNANITHYKRQVDAKNREIKTKEAQLKKTLKEIKKLESMIHKNERALGYSRGTFMQRMSNKMGSFFGKKQRTPPQQLSNAAVPVAAQQLSNAAVPVAPVVSGNQPVAAQHVSGNTHRFRSVTQNIIGNQRNQRRIAGQLRKPNVGNIATRAMIAKRQRPQNQI